jgi:hypothetical protein
MFAAVTVILALAPGDISLVLAPVAALIVPELAKTIWRDNSGSKRL